MDKSNPLIRDMIIEYLGEPVRVIRAYSGAKAEIIFYAKDTRQSPLIAFGDFVDAFLDDARSTDLPTLAKAYDRAVRLSVSSPLLLDLIQSLDAFLVWARNRKTTGDRNAG